MAQIVLNNGHLYTLDFIRPNQIGKSCRLEDIKMLIEDMAQENISGATVKDEPGLTKMGNLKLNSFSVNFKDGKYNITIFFDEVPQSEIDLAKERAETEAVARFIALGLQNAEIKDVIKWAKFLEDWKPRKFPYKKGERFKHNGNPYEVVEAVTSDAINTPDKDSKHYKLLKEQENSQDKPKVEIKPWNDKTTYSKGDLVIARGIVFISRIDNNKGNEPGFGSAWDYYKEK
ncbi:hypothetical protein [uncultured Solobacterium sp.]|uniref:hypothetical protein n=1 Tax=uncultured Solobacterium sp. TaxID=747375 RepID=UPI0026070104|nr:hypothetical protein [uncultured Solobacterium sp.]